jgi:hypothetical protein
VPATDAAVAAALAGQSNNVTTFESM